MHWVLVSADHHPDHGGIGAHVSAFTAAAVARGWRVDLVTRPGDRHPEGARVIPVSCEDDREDFHDRLPRLRAIERVRPYRFGLFSLAAAGALLELEEPPDVVEFVDCRAEGWVALHSEAVRERLAGSRMIIRAHTPMFVAERICSADPSRFGRAIYHRWEQEALAAADGVIASSALQADRLGCPWPVPVIPNPVAPHPPAPRAADELIVVVGSAQPLKGTDVWASSLVRVLRERPGASAMLLGPDTPSGPDGTSMQEHCRSLIDEDLRPRFCCAGPATHERAIEAITAATVVVVPSLHESFSYAAAEAIVRERPVVLTDGVGIAETVEDAAPVPAGDAAALAAAQLEILADPDAAVARAREMRRQLLAACNPRLHLDRCESCLQTIGAGTAPPDDGCGDGIDVMADFLEGVRAHEAMVEHGAVPWSESAIEPIGAAGPPS